MKRRPGLCIQTRHSHRHQEKGGEGRSEKACSALPSQTCGDPASGQDSPWMPPRTCPAAAQRWHEQSWLGPGLRTWRMLFPRRGGITVSLFIVSPFSSPVLGCSPRGSVPSCESHDTRHLTLSRPLSPALGCEDGVRILFILSPWSGLLPALVRQAHYFQVSA